jgi:hypothetical protein
MGLDVEAIRRQLSSGSVTSKASRQAAADSADTKGSRDYTQLHTHGYCPQEVEAGRAAKQRCLQAMAGEGFVVGVHAVVHAPASVQPCSTSVYAAFNTASSSSILQHALK